MRILIDPGGYFCDHNLGDLAMLQVAFARCRQAWPEAAIEIVTHTPDRLRVRCPGAEPVHGTSRQAWWLNNLRSVRPLRFVPEAIIPRLMLIESAFRARSQKNGIPDTNAASTNTPEGKPFLQALDAADLFIISGQGGLNDCFVEHATGTLLALDRAIRSGKPTVMLSQGVGPITNSKLRQLARLVLPRVSLIFLREALMGPALLKSLGCSADQWVVTGDDALDLAVEKRFPTAPATAVSGSGRSETPQAHAVSAMESRSRTAIGINARVARYSAVNEMDLPGLKQSIQELARKFDAPLLGLPIWRPRNEGDLSAIRSLSESYEGPTDRGESLDSPEALVERVNNCRLVVTGSYHAAVFALALGIPVIALTNSPYYDSKFQGLADQFPGGLSLVNVRDGDYRTKLIETGQAFWDKAPELESDLQRAAARQVDAAKGAFARSKTLLPLSK